MTSHGDDVEVQRARMVMGREMVMAHLSEICLEGHGPASESLLAWQLADQTLVLTMAAATVAQSALAAWAEATGQPMEECLQQLALRVATANG